MKTKKSVASVREPALRYRGLVRGRLISTAYNLQSNKGFALLLTLVVISVVLAIGLSLLQVTVKQLSLSSLARESTIALYAANTGLECMQFHRSIPDTRSKFLRDDTNDWPPDLNCADVNQVAGSKQAATLVDGSSSQWLYNYQYQFELDYGAVGSADNACVETSLYIADLRDSSTDIEDEPVTGEGLTTVSCTSGTICTTIFARGYNRPCDQLNSIFTVQRELTIEY